MKSNKCFWCGSEKNIITTTAFLKPICHVCFNAGVKTKGINKKFLTEEAIEFLRSKGEI